MKIKSRKETRKESRRAKKLKRHEYFLKQKADLKKKNKGKDYIPKDGINLKGSKYIDNKPLNEPINAIKSKGGIKLMQKSVSIKSFDSQYDRIEYERQKVKRIREKLKRDTEKARIEKLKSDNEKEEIEIKKLEKQMKLKKGKSNAFVLDGLDYLLDVCDKKFAEYELEKTFNESDSEFERDFETITGTIKANSFQSKISQKSFQSGSTNGENNDFDEKLEGNYNSDTSMEDDYDYLECGTETSSENSASDKKIEKGEHNKEFEDLRRKRIKINDCNSKKKVKCIFAENDSSIETSHNAEFAVEGNVHPTGDNEKETNKLWEDIYGRTRDKCGNVIRAYMPPHLRLKAETPNENIIKLKRQIKGLLNRLAESNMAYISSQVEQLYMSNSRNDMNKTMFVLYQESLLSDILTPEKLIIEHAMLVAVLHTNVGSEIGAYFLQYSIMEFMKAYESKLPVSNKRLNNILIFIMHLYNFQLFHCKLMYDIINQLVKTFEEKEIELILLALKTVGFNLRKNDPVALKNLILKVQVQANKNINVQSNVNGTRVRFMLEILMAIKNNNMTKIPNYNPELVERLKKSIKVFVRKGNFSTELNISLQDLINAEKHGRWWIVGSAWSGQMPQNLEGAEKDKDSEISNPLKFSKKLLELAKKQRMNTDVRRNVFCILMSSEDYLEAFEKLLKLKLKGSVEREIMNIILHCALQEKSFNLYYMHLANKFCKFDRKYQIMLQCAIWDKIKEINGFLPIQVTNLAKFVGTVILGRGLPISVLKVVEFSELDKRTVKFMRQVLLTILLDENRNAAVDVFKRISSSAELKLFQESLRLFLQHFLLRNTKNIQSKEVIRLTEMVNLSEKALISNGGNVF